MKQSVREPAGTRENGGTGPGWQMFSTGWIPTIPMMQYALNKKGNISHRIIDHANAMSDAMRKLLLVSLTIAIVALIPAPVQAYTSQGYTSQGYFWWVLVKDKPLLGSVLGFRDAQAFVRWMGCQAQVVLWDVPVVNAGFFPGADKIVILQGLRDAIPGEEPLAAVLAHEAGHCLQRAHPARFAYARTRMELEYDAEAHAHKILRILKQDADVIIKHLRLTFARLDHRDPESISPTHGSALGIWRWARDHDGLGRAVLNRFTPGMLQ